MNRRRGTQFGVLLLASELYRHGLHHIPPVTLVTVAINTLGYLGFIPRLASPGSTCVSYVNVWKKKQYQRLLLASFVHLDDMHLYYNMASFIWKGKSLEQRFGSKKFAIIIALFSVLSQLVMIVLNKTFATYIFFNSDYLYQCAAGFSAVLFALKVLTTHYTPSAQILPLGLPIPVPPKLACWVELVVIQILVPNASFTGHLAGILVGLMYLNSPLARMVDSVTPGLSGVTNTATSRSRSGAFQTESRRLGGQDEDRDLQEAIRRSLQDSHISQRNSQSPPPPGWNIGGFGNGSPSYPQTGGHSTPPYPTMDYGSMPSFPRGHRSGFQHSVHSSAPPLDEMNTSKRH